MTHNRLSKFMQTLQEHFKNSAVVGVSSLVLAACGGGGGGSASTSAPAEAVEVQSYTPDAERLKSPADSSMELYVEENFAFDQTLVTHLTVRVLDETGGNNAFSRLNVYLIDVDGLDAPPTQWTDELSTRAQLVTGGMSDAQGVFTRIIELPKGQQAPLILIEANVLGIENKQLLSVDSETTSITLG